jgi:hypothetical protein
METQDPLLNSLYSLLTGMCSNSFKNGIGDGPNFTGMTTYARHIARPLGLLWNQ